MNFAYTLKDRHNYLEVGVVEAASLEAAKTKVEEAVEGGNFEIEITPLFFDRYGLAMLHATPINY